LQQHRRIPKDRLISESVALIADATAAQFSVSVVQLTIGTRFDVKLLPSSDTAAKTPTRLYDDLNSLLQTAGQGLKGNTPSERIFFGKTTNFPVREIYCTVNGAWHKLANCDSQKANASGDDDEVFAGLSAGLLAVVIGCVAAFICFIFAVVCNKHHSMHDHMCKMHCWEHGAGTHKVEPIERRGLFG
jgi:hypothetical protein